MSASAQTPPAAHDQSMDDILASIRRILNEDEAGAAQAPEAGAATAPEKPSEPLASAMPAAARVEEKPAPVAPKVGPEPLELTSEMMVSPPVLSPPVAPAAFGGGALATQAEMGNASGLIAPAAAAAAAASMGSLLRAVSSERSAPVYRGGPSIEDVVREEMRPILKDWLDTHLPPLVERLVRAEIERVVNRGMP